MKNDFEIRNILLIALHTALLVVCAWINIPFIIPFTLQTLAIFIAFKSLGGVKALISILLYVIIGAIGFPAFAGMKGGLGVLFGPTGGYIFGFILSAVVYIFLEKIKINNFWFDILKLFITLIICYIVGTTWFMFIYGVKNDYTLWKALTTCVTPFILIDVAKIFIAEIVVTRIKKIIK